MKKNLRKIAAAVLLVMVLMMCASCSGQSYTTRDTQSTGAVYAIGEKQSSTEYVEGNTVEIIKDAEGGGTTQTPNNSGSGSGNGSSTDNPSTDNPSTDNPSDNNSTGDNSGDTPSTDTPVNTTPVDDRDYSTTCMSFNILAYDTHSVGYAAPSVRFNYIVQIVNKYEPDLLGMQEVMAASPYNDNFDTYNGLLSSFTKYDHRALIDEKGSTVTELNIGSGLVIFWKKDRFELQDSGAAVYTIDGGRHYQWVKLYDKQEKVTILFTNTHFSIDGGDAAGGQAKRNAEANQLRQFWDRNCTGDMELYATGDYNHTTSETATYESLNKTIFRSARDVALNANQSSYIDFVYINNDTQYIYNYQRVNDVFGTDDENTTEAKYRPSDHWPIIAYSLHESA